MGKPKLNLTEFKCRICGKNLSEKAGLDHHMQLHSTEKPFECHICPHTCKTKKYLSAHIKKVHRKATGNECSVCGKRFHFKSLLEKHMYTHTNERPFKCEICAKGFNSMYSLSTHKFIHSGAKPFQCKYCSYACRDSSTLRRHEERHMGITRTYQCKACDKSYKTKRVLKVHITRVHMHLDVKTRPCAQCGKMFSTEKNLNNHVRQCHERLYACQCDICGMTIANKYNMRSHLTKHIDYKPFKCSFQGCTKRYKDKATLKKHTIIHYPDKQFACEICKKPFTRLYRMITHKKQHQAKRKCVFCDHCGKSFYNKNYLSSHITRKHITRQPFICDICGFLTYNKPSIVMHIKYGHVSEADRQCKICKKKYKKHVYLKLHYWKTHSIKYKMNRYASRKLKKRTKCTVEDANVLKDMKLLHEIKVEALNDADQDFNEHLNYTDAVLTSDATPVIHETSTGDRSREKSLKDFFIEHIYTPTSHGETPEIESDIEVDLESHQEAEKIKEVMLERCRQTEGVTLKKVRWKYDESKIQRGKLEIIDFDEIESGNVLKKYIKKLQKKKSKKTVIHDNRATNNNLKNKGNMNIKNKRVSKYSDDTTVDDDSDHPTDGDEDRLELTQNDEAMCNDKNSMNNIDHCTSSETVKNTEKDKQAVVESCKNINYTNVNIERELKESNKTILVDNVDKNKIDVDEIQQINELEDVNDEYEAINDKNSNNNKFDFKEHVKTNILKTIVKDISNEPRNKQIDINNSGNCDSKIDNNRRFEQISELNIRPDDLMETVNNNLISYLEDVDKTADVNEKAFVKDVNITKTRKRSVRNVTKNSIYNSEINIHKVIAVSKFKQTNNKIQSTADNITLKNNQSDLKENKITKKPCVKSVDNNIDLEKQNDIDQYFDQDLNTSRKRRCVKNKNNNFTNYSDDQDDHERDDGDKDYIPDEEIDGKRKEALNKFQINIHQCYVCFKLYETKEKLLDHCKEHFDVCNTNMLKKCPLCDYVTKLDLTRHIRLVHKINVNILYGTLKDRKNNNNKSRFYFNVENNKVNEIEVIPSIKNLNRQAFLRIDRERRENNDKGLKKTKLVKKDGEWIVEKEAINAKAENYVLPETVDKDELLKNSKDDYVAKMKKLSRIAKKNGQKMLFPCEKCKKICQTVSALKLHMRRHDPNPKPFKKKVWKHKLSEEELKRIDEAQKEKETASDNRYKKPKPIVNKHKCDPKLKDFYENNIKGGDVEFWQFLKIFNKMTRENVNDFADLEKRPEFGIHYYNNGLDQPKPKSVPSKTPEGKTVDVGKKRLSRKVKKLVNNYKRTIMISRKEYNKRKAIQDFLRKKNLDTDNKI